MKPSADHVQKRPRARALVRKDDVRKAVAGAIGGGMPVGRIEFDVSLGRFSLYAVDPNAPTSDALDLERRMREAFDE